MLIFQSHFRGATAETVKKAFEILLRDPKVKSIFINIFGGMYNPVANLTHSTQFSPGIMRCDFIAEGVIKATKELQLDIPLVVRLKGTKEIEAKQYVPSLVIY
jgi:succinyl-CoA synthetase beta subunit